MLNKITRRVPISRYSVDFVLDGFEEAKKHVEFETLSGLKSADLFEIAYMYIDDLSSIPGGTVYLSTDYREMPIGVFTYEMPLTHFIEQAIRRGEKNVPEEE